jgi:hypothetical protein
MLLSQKSTDSLDYAHLMIFRDSTFQYVSIRKLKENVFSGKAVITEDTIYLTYNDTVPNVGHKAHYTKDYIEFVQADNVKLEIKLNRFPPSRE